MPGGSEDFDMGDLQAQSPGDIAGVIYEDDVEDAVLDALEDIDDGESTYSDLYNA